uniref:ATP-dependent Clp protease proteolytic subunit n=1 Tax=Silene wilfordii TaxID=1850527 RepID=A0A1Z1B906_9CARY|nr:clp protease proteolytic subunit [Silene wilfordii]ANG08129.1 clp protease proteolytic subunit [Silene wilfordii]
MPIGVPKVPFRIPGDEEASWVDLYTRLYRQRALFLCDDLEEEITNQIVGLMVYLSIEDPTKDLFLFINSSGGLAVHGLGIYDIMQNVPPDVHTVCIGMAASMASVILVGGEITQRLAFPHARVMIHQPACTYFRATAGEALLEANILLRLREIITRLYVQRTRKPLWVVTEDLERDTFMSAEEAQAHGIVDLVGI